MTRFLAVAAVSLLIVLPGCSAVRPLQRYDYTRLCMGVQTRISLFAEDETSAFNAAAQAFTLIGSLEASMSDYRPDSELSQISRNPVGQAVAVSEDLYRVLELSQQLARQTDGAFDVTIGPLVSQWRRARDSGVLPSITDRREALGRTGWPLLHLDPVNQSVRLDTANMQLDLGGIAKGYAAQRAVHQLRSQGISRCLVAMAGDVVAGDPPPDHPGWVVEVHHTRGQDASRQIHLANAAISTSGDEEQFVEIDGVRYSHIVDPRTGLGMMNRRSVSVLSPRGEWSDALATALYVLGPDSIDHLIRDYPGTAVILTTDEQSPRIHDPSNRFRWFLQHYPSGDRD